MALAQKWSGKNVLHIERKNSSQSHWI